MTIESVRDGMEQRMDDLKAIELNLIGARWSADVHCRSAAAVPCLKAAIISHGRGLIAAKRRARHVAVAFPINLDGYCPGAKVDHNGALPLGSWRVDESGVILGGFYKAARPNLDPTTDRERLLRMTVGWQNGTAWSRRHKVQTNWSETRKPPFPSSGLPFAMSCCPARVTNLDPATTEVLKAAINPHGRGFTAFSAPLAKGTASPDLAGQTSSSGVGPEGLGVAPAHLMRLVSVARVKLRISAEKA
ncbi:hypothetical protein DFH09DRAFT_1109302 [Mycena vulgaris]|nr:hypothetical protein DFH09DRAFT_1109302 [Mycena vulgaris]